VSVLLTGRPFILDEVVAASNAFIAAWLPGTSGGEAIVNSLFGEYLFKNSDENDLRNTLPIDWMADSDSLVDFPIYRPDGKIPEFKN
jgi:beta-glucosidase